MRQLALGFLLGAGATAAIWLFVPPPTPSGIARAQTNPPGTPPAPGGQVPPAVPGSVENPQGLGPGATPIPGGIPAPIAMPPEELRFAAMPPGDPGKGKDAIVKYGCGSCHDIAGVPGADGKVGPPLTGVGSRVYIGGVLRNTEFNIVRWIQNPQAFVPNVDMPNLGVTDEDARNIAAYLGTLR